MIEAAVVLAIVGVVTALSVPVGMKMIREAKRARMLVQLQTMSDDQLLFQRDRGTFYPEVEDSQDDVFVFERFLPETPFPLPGRESAIEGSPQRYAFYLLRLEPYYPEPIVFALANTGYGNDLDGDSFGDLWIKVGSAPAQVFMDDLTNTTHVIPWEGIEDFASDGTP